MLKHVQQSVAAAAWGWFRDHRQGLRVYYEPQAAVDPRFRLQFEDTLAHHPTYHKMVDTEADPENWSKPCYLATVQVLVMFRQALDAVGPVMLRRAHDLIGHDPHAAAVARQKPDRRANPVRRASDAYRKDFSPKRRVVRDALRAAKTRTKRARARRGKG